MSERKLVTLEDIERRLGEAHLAPYYQWIRQQITLSAGALTALVALQSSFVPKNPQGLWILKLSLVGLALCIILGVAALSSEWRTPLAGVRNMRKMRRQFGDIETARRIERNDAIAPGKFHKYSVLVLPWMFSGSLGLLMIFAVINL